MTVKVAELCPWAIATVVGTLANELLLDRETLTPPGPAAPESTTVPVEVFPPTNVVGFRLTWVRVAGVMVSVAVGEAPPKLAVMVEVA